MPDPQRRWRTEAFRFRDARVDRNQVADVATSHYRPLVDAGQRGCPAPQARGAIFRQCNNALEVVTARLAREFGGSAEAIRAELLAWLNPGVKLVPAHTMLLGLAQEHGCTYEQIG